MPRSKNAGRNANGLGNIRKKHISANNGTVYEYWEARVTVGFDPGTGKQLQLSITGKTQKEVAEMLGISQSYISRIEKKILGRMKKDLTNIM